MATGDKLVNLDVLKNTVHKEVVDLKTAFTINATPASAMSIEGGWVNVTLDKTNAEIIQAASSGKSIVKLQNYGATIIYRQAEYTSYAVYFHGVSIDNSLLIYNVMVTSSSAQAALVGSVAMTR